MSKLSCMRTTLALLPLLLACSAEAPPTSTTFLEHPTRLQLPHQLADAPRPEYNTQREVLGRHVKLWVSAEPIDCEADVFDRIASGAGFITITAPAGQSWPGIWDGWTGGVAAGPVEGTVQHIEAQEREGRWQGVVLFERAGEGLVQLELDAGPCAPQR